MKSTLDLGKNGLDKRGHRTYPSAILSSALIYLVPYIKFLIASLLPLRYNRLNLNF